MMHFPKRIILLYSFVCFFLSTLLYGAGASPILDDASNSVSENNPLPTTDNSFPTDSHKPTKNRNIISKRDDLYDVPPKTQSYKPKTARYSFAENAANKMGIVLEEDEHYAITVKWLNEENSLILDPPDRTSYSDDFLEKEKLKERLTFKHIALVVGKVDWDGRSLGFIGKMVHLGFTKTFYQTSTFQDCPVAVATNNIGSWKTEPEVECVQKISENQHDYIIYNSKNEYMTDDKCVYSTVDNHCGSYVQFLLEKLKDGE